MKPIYRNKLTLAALIAATWLPISCSHDNTITPVGGRTVQVELTAEIGSPTSATRTLTRVANNKWELNDMVGLYMITNTGSFPTDIVSDADGPYANKRYKIAEGEGTSGFKLVAATPEDAMYYPEDDSQVKFIAYYPYSSNITDYKYAIDIKNQDGTIQHDLLYSTNATGKSSSATGNITFDHQLSKLAVKLKPLQSTLDLSVMSGQVTDVPVTADFHLVDGTIDNTTTGNIRADDNYTQDSGEDFPGGGDVIYTCFDIILIPHTAGTERRLNFATATQNYYWILPDDLMFEGGKEYTVVLGIDGDQMNVESITIGPWGEGGETLSIPMVKIPAGKFWMGAPDGQTQITWNGQTFTPDADPLRLPDGREEPIHEVIISKDYYIGKYAITASQYCLFLNANLDKFTSTASEVTATLSGTDSFGETYNYPDVVLIISDVRTIEYIDGRWSPVSGYENYPIGGVSWYGAFAFCEWTGGRLPTEAEWEYACYGGDYFYGIQLYRWISFDEKALGDYAWYKDNNTVEAGNGYAPGIKPGGLKLPNAWGLYDMVGNVWEWCYDWRDENFYTNTVVTDPVNVDSPDSKNHRIARGGCFISPKSDCRTAVRGTTLPASATYTFGFRVVFPIN